MLDAVESVIGPDILLLSTALFTKSPSDGTEECLTIIGAHQDRQYWAIAPMSSPVVSGWVAVDDADEENGAMIFHSGSHLRLA